MALVAIVFDTGVLGMVTHPSKEGEAWDCKQWFERRLRDGCAFIVPEIADYELRRSFLHRGFVDSINRLDELKRVLTYLPITTEVMNKAAEFWADATKQGRPTAPDPALDGDVILAAQAVLQADRKYARETLVATDDVRHLEMFVKAKRWPEIQGSES